jgi:uncharacterized protein (DUF1800 family)
MYKIIISTAISAIAFTSSMAQQYKDYIGAGHNVGMTVTSSSNSGGTNGSKILDGSGMDAAFYEASRFGAQATFGVKPADIDIIKNMGYEAWIDDQFTKSPSLILPTMNGIWSYLLTIDPNGFGPYSLHFNYAWWQTNMTNQDLLRQRVAYALSQILVISAESGIRDHGDALSSYYDILVNNAFGNYKDILYAIAKHPSMGFYLSHLNNPKSVPAQNIYPDQNFAREIMQLFTIGLYQLNADGTRVLNANNQSIPTYNNNDIINLAKVFTGLGGGGNTGTMYCTQPVEFGTSFYCINKTIPMVMYASQHEPGAKTFLGFTIPGQTTYTNTQAMNEVNTAIDFLFNHANTAPFVSKLLIQRFTTSNPSSAYVGRVAAKFINNGQGVRGDMKAVIKAILLDPEARSVASYMQEHGGKVREPFIRMTQLVRALPTTANTGRYWHNGYNFLEDTDQHVLHAPSVFNFYLPNHQPVGDLIDIGLVSPEMKLHNTATAITYNNLIWGSTSPWNWAVLYSWIGAHGNDRVQLNYTYMQSIADDSELLINYLDRIFTHGQMTKETRQLLRTNLNQLWNINDANNYRRYRVSIALSTIMTSPDYFYTK